MIRVMKFGGTSVGSIERIQSVARRIAFVQKEGHRPVVIASAMAGETNRLVGLAAQIDGAYRGLAYDMLVASGEQVAVALLAIALEKLGLQAKPLLAFQIGIQTDSLYSKARIQHLDPAPLRHLVDRGVIPVVAGFQGVDDEDHITTLGRGGSDTTAVAVAAALKAEACEIYTDVPAVFSADPRLVPKAREIPRLSFEEMLEMASLGAKVLHIRSVEIAAKYEVPIHLRSSFEERDGTWIQSEEKGMESPVVTAVSHDQAITVFKLFPVPQGPGFLAELFGRLTEKGVIVDIITQSFNEEGQRLAFSVNNEDVPVTREIVESLVAPKGQVTIMDRMAKVSVVGVGMRNHPGVAARFFEVMQKLNIPVHLVTTSEIKISAVVQQEHLEKAAQGLHHTFDLDR